MTLWQSIKQGFGYGLGGTLGWHVGNGIAWLLRKLWLLILAGPLVYGLATMDADPSKAKPAVQKERADHNSHRPQNKPPSTAKLGASN